MPPPMFCVPMTSWQNWRLWALKGVLRPRRPLLSPTQALNLDEGETGPEQDTELLRLTFRASPQAASLLGLDGPRLEGLSGRGPVDIPGVFQLRSARACRAALSEAYFYRREGGLGAVLGPEINLLRSHPRPFSPQHAALGTARPPLSCFRS